MTTPSIIYHCPCGALWEWASLVTNGTPMIRICAVCGTVIMLTITARPAPGCVSAEGASWAMEGAR